MLKNRATVYKWAAVTSLSAILILFTHCGNPMADKGDLVWSDEGVSVSLSGSSGASSLQAFEQTVYPITRAHCTNCHGNSQQPLHASSNSTTAHNAVVNSYKVDFNNIPNSRMVQKLRESHNCWGSCTANAMEMQLAIEDWKSLMAATSGGGPTNPPVSGNNLYNKTTSISRTLELEGINTGVVTLRYSLNSLGIAGGILEVRVQNYDEYSYRLSQLRIISPNQNVEVKGVYLLMNGSFNPQNANLTQIEQRVPQGNGGTMLNPSAMIVLKDRGPAMDTLAFGFEELE